MHLHVLCTCRQLIRPQSYGSGRISCLRALNPKPVARIPSPDAHVGELLQPLETLLQPLEMLLQPLEEQPAGNACQAHRGSAFRVSGLGKGSGFEGPAVRVSVSDLGCGTVARTHVDRLRRYG